MVISLFISLAVFFVRAFLEARAARSFLGAIIVSRLKKWGIKVNDELQRKKNGEEVSSDVLEVGSDLQKIDCTEHPL